MFHNHIKKIHNQNRKFIKKNITISLQTEIGVKLEVYLLNWKHCEHSFYILNHEPAPLVMRNIVDWLELERQSDPPDFQGFHTKITRPCKCTTHIGVAVQASHAFQTTGLCNSRMHNCKTCFYTHLLMCIHNLPKQNVVQLAIIINKRR